jgi:hypothetical protein
MIGGMPLLLLLACAPPPDPSGWTPLEADPWPISAPDPIPAPAALAGIPDLDDASVWAFDGDPDGRGTTGSFGVGNGLVFGLIGLDDPVSTLTAATGPTLELDGGAFGDAAITLPGTPTRQRAQRPRGTNVARTRLDYGALSLSTTDAAAPGLPVIVRNLTVENTGSAALTQVEIRIARGSQEEAPQGERGLRQDRGDRQLLITCEGGSVVDDVLVVPIAVPEGGHVSLTCAWRFGEAAFDVPIDGPALLAEAGEADRAWRALAAEVEVGDPAVSDLIDGLLLTMRAQTHPTGVVSPMHRYGRGWLRDAEGPVSLYVAAGRPDEAQRVLDGTYAGLVAAGEIANSFDLPEGDAPEAPDWSAVPFMPGRNPAEAPSYAPILAGKVWRATGEAPDEARRAFLRACLDRQEADADGVFPFSGDETYRWPMSLVIGAMPETLGGSVASNGLYAAAARELEAMGEPYDGEAAVSAVSGMSSPIVGQDLPPYEDVAAMHAWLGLGEGPLDDAVDALWDDGVLRSQALTGGPTLITGMNPGYTLYALDEAGDPLAADAFAALPRIASASGHFEELHDAGLDPFVLSHAPDGLGDEVTARFRPWEGGVVGASVLHHVAGVHPDAPTRSLTIHPNGVSGRLTRLSFLGDAYDVEIEAFAEGDVVRIERIGGSGEWTLRVPVAEGARAWVDGERVKEGPAVATVAPDGSAEVVIER